MATDTKTLRPHHERRTRPLASAASAVASSIVSSAPGVARTTQRVIRETGASIEGGSDELLLSGASIGLGLSLGLILGGANRILILISLLLVGGLGLAMVDRAAGRLGHRRLGAA